MKPYMLHVEHTPKQKAISFIAFLWAAGTQIGGIVSVLINGSSTFAKLGQILGAVVVILAFAYICWFTFTYRFQADENKIVRKTGFTRVEIKWKDVVTWSIKSRPKKKTTFHTEPILKDAKGQEISLDADIWYSSSNIAQAREQFLGLVQSKIPDKCENRA